MMDLWYATSFAKVLSDSNCYSVCSQLLPHAANVVRLVTEYFRRAVLAPIRIKLYSIIQILLISMGVGKYFLKHSQNYILSFFSH